MPTRLAGLLVATLLPFAFATSTGRAAEPRDFATHVLTNAELDALLAKPGQILIVDVRSPEEIARNGSFAVFLNVPGTELEARAASIPRERPIVTVSNHANRAGRAADVLARLGFRIAGAAGSQSYEDQGGKLYRASLPRAPKSEGDAKPR